jgi:hypothetical protein
MKVDDKLLEVQAHTPYYYAHLDRPLADGGSRITSTTRRPRMYCNPYCNRTSTGWYAVDKQPCQKCPKPHK